MWRICEQGTFLRVHLGSLFLFVLHVLFSKSLMHMNVAPGDLFDIGAPLDGLPSYDESVDSASDAGLVANDEVDTDSERADSVSDVPAELQGATHDELQAYLEADASFGESDLSGQYHNPDNPFN